MNRAGTNLGPAPARRMSTRALWRIGLSLVLWLGGLSPATASPLEKNTQKGPVKASVRLEPAEPAIGDPVTLTLEVTAQKGVELLMPGFGQAMERLTILDFASTEKVDPDGHTVVTQQYQLQPEQSGQQSIPPLMVEFVDRRQGAKPAPDGMDAYEMLTPRLGFNVQSVLPKDADAELHPPLGELPLRQSSRRWTWWSAAGGLGLIALAVAALAWRWFAVSGRRARRRSAYEIASTRLASLLSRPCDEPSQVHRFFVELSAIVRQYLEDRFELRAPDLTTEEFLDRISGSPDLVSEHQTLLRQFLRRADLVKFANMVPSAKDIDQSVAAARRFLDETRLDDQHTDRSVAQSTTAGVARI